MRECLLPGRPDAQNKFDNEKHVVKVLFMERLFLGGSVGTLLSSGIPVAARQRAVVHCDGLPGARCNTVAWVLSL